MTPTSSTRPLTFLNRLAVAMLAFTALAACARDSHQNKNILAALEPFESLTETALTGNAAKVAIAYKTVQGSRPNARMLLSGAMASRFDELFAQLEATHAQHDYIGESLQAAELYKLMVLSLDTTALTAPTKEVNLLDYVGFRLTALLQAPSPDWTAIAATTTEANGYWAAIRDQVGDAQLQRKMDETQKSIASGAERQDASLTRSSVKNDLDLVDELERYFATK